MKYDTLPNELYVCDKRARRNAMSARGQGDFMLLTAIHAGNARTGYPGRELSGSFVDVQTPTAGALMSRPRQKVGDITRGGPNAKRSPAQSPPLPGILRAGLTQPLRSAHAGLAQPLHSPRAAPPQPSRSLGEALTQPPRSPSADLALPGTFRRPSPAAPRPDHNRR